MTMFVCFVMKINMSRRKIFKLQIASVLLIFHQLVPLFGKVKGIEILERLGSAEFLDK